MARMTVKRIFWFSIAVTLGVAPLRAEVPVEPDAAEKTEFIRYVDDKKGGATLDAAIVSYRNQDGVEVDLLSALHVGEKAYYEALSEQFTTYDALLYELIKPKDAAAPVKGQKTGGAISGFQRFLKDVLKLSFQLDEVDYQAENFVHADLDAETFTKMQDERGESIFGLMLRSMLAEMNRQGQGKGGRPPTLFDLLAAMKAEDSDRQFKLLLGRQFQDIEAQMSGIEGKNGSVILTERNKAAVKVLKEQIEAGRKKLGIFYSAAHMRGIEEAMIEDMGFERTGVKWLTAWDMTAPAKAEKIDAEPARDEEVEELDADGK